MEESHGDDNGDYDREDDADDGGGGDDGEMRVFFKITI